jgi:hypothetical protein
VLDVAQDAAANAKDQRAVAAHQLGERALIPPLPPARQESGV